MAESFLQQQLKLFSDNQSGPKFTLIYGNRLKGYKKTTLELKDVPANVMQVARKKLPGVTFETAWQLSNGMYEVRGKAKNGKVREIDINPDGTVVEIE